MADHGRLQSFDRFGAPRPGPKVLDVDNDSLANRDRRWVGARAVMDAEGTGGLIVHGEPAMADPHRSRSTHTVETTIRGLVVSPMTPAPSVGTGVRRFSASIPTSPFKRSADE